ncbi:MAG: hypothetical protein PVF49_09705 [Anaerolineales bacterium]
MNLRQAWLPLLMMVAALAASGCLPDEMPTQVVPTPTFTPESQLVEVGEGGADAPEPAATTIEAAPEATPFDLAQLRATNPSTVDLASGQPTLLEFFAFW